MARGLNANMWVCGQIFLMGCHSVSDKSPGAKCLKPLHNTACMLMWKNVSVTHRYTNTHIMCVLYSRVSMARHGKVSENETDGNIINGGRARKDVLSVC